MATAKRAQRAQGEREWKPRELGRALDALRKHLRECPICKTWRPDYQRNPQCNRMRESVNGVVFLWNNVPAGQTTRQLAMFSMFQEGEETDPAPF